MVTNSDLKYFRSNKLLPGDLNKWSRAERLLKHFDKTHFIPFN